MTRRWRPDTKLLGLPLFLLGGAGVSFLGPRVVLLGLLPVLPYGIVRIVRHQAKDRSSDSDLLLDVFLLPSLIGIGSYSTRIALVAAIPLVCIGLNRMGQARWNVDLAFPFTLMLLASVPVLLRPASALTLLGLTAVLVALPLAVSDRIPARRVAISIVEGLGAYLVLNVLGYLAGRTSSGAALRAVSHSVTGGPFGLRVFFPFASNAAAPAAAAALFLVGSFAVAGHDRRRLLRCSSVVAAVFVGLGANYRGPLVAGGIALLLAWVAPKLLIGLAPAIAIFMFTLPFSYGVVRPFTDPAIHRVTNAVPYLARKEDRGVVGRLSGRDKVWRLSVDYWQHTPLIERFVGWGNNGQFRSGASQSYAAVLRGAVSDPTQATVHNSGLQEAFDGGVLGYVALLGAVVLAFRRWGQQGNVLAVALVVTACLIGATDATAAPGRVDVSFLVVLLLVATVRRPVHDHATRLRSVADAATAEDAAMLVVMDTPTT